MIMPHNEPTTSIWIDLKIASYRVEGKLVMVGLNIYESSAVAFLSLYLYLSRCDAVLSPAYVPIGCRSKRIHIFQVNHKFSVRLRWSWDASADSDLNGQFVWNECELMRLIERRYRGYTRWTPTLNAMRRGRRKQMVRSWESFRYIQQSAGNYLCMYMSYCIG